MEQHLDCGVECDCCIQVVFAVQRTFVALAISCYVEFREFRGIARSLEYETYFQLLLAVPCCRAQAHTSVLCVEHEGICSGVRREMPPFPSVTGCGFPHVVIKLPDLPSDSFIPGTRLRACCIPPSPGEQYLGKGTSLQSTIAHSHGFFHIHGANGGYEEVNGSYTEN